MIRRQTLILGIVLAILGSYQAHAMVYKLIKGYSLKDVRGLLKAKSALKDTVTVNGVKGEMEAFFSPLTFSEALIALKPALKKSSKVLGQGTVVIDVSTDKWIDRLLILKAGTHSKVVVFQMRLPADKKGEDPDGSWPADVAKPVGARIERVIKLGKSGASFCQFSMSADSTYMGSYGSSLESGGWSAMVDEGGAGGTYLNASRDKMLIFSSWKDGKRAYGSVFLRTIKSPEKK